MIFYGSTDYCGSLTEYGITPAENYAGEVTGDDYILAVDCSEAGASTTVADYAPVAPTLRRSARSCPRIRRITSTCTRERAR